MCSAAAHKQHEQGDLTVPAEAAAQSSGQAYTYFSEFDHTSMRISSVHIGPEPAPELKRLPEARLIGADFFAGMVRPLPQSVLTAQRHDTLTAQDHDQKRLILKLDECPPFC